MILAITKTTLLLLLGILGRRPAKAQPCLNCLFTCCDNAGNTDYSSSNPTCVANGNAFCPTQCNNQGSGCVTDTTSITLGVRFITSKDICISGIQFYNEDSSQAFTTSPWHQPTQSPLLIESVPSGSGGWYTSYVTYLPMSPGDEFVAAYSAPSGAYAYQYHFFNSNVTKGPVTFKGGVNGVYKYGAPNLYPGDGPFQNSNYFVTPIWEAGREFFVWDPTTDSPVGQIYDGYVGCIRSPYNLEAVLACQSPPWVFFKLYNWSTKTVVIRSNETESRYFLWGNLGADVLPNRKPLPNNVYQLYTSIGTKTEIITFTQAC